MLNTSIATLLMSIRAPALVHSQRIEVDRPNETLHPTIGAVSYAVRKTDDGLAKIN